LGGGVSSTLAQRIEVTRQEICKLETRLKDEKARLAQGLREGLEGAKEAILEGYNETKSCIDLFSKKIEKKKFFNMPVFRNG